MRLIDSMQSERKSHSTKSFCILFIKSRLKGKAPFSFGGLSLSRVYNLGFYSNLDGFWNLKERERDAFPQATFVRLFELPLSKDDTKVLSDKHQKQRQEERERDFRRIIRL